MSYIYCIDTLHTRGVQGSKPWIHTSSRVGSEDMLPRKNSTIEEVRSSDNLMNNTSTNGKEFTR